jgi:hypothetical protein
MSKARRAVDVSSRQKRANRRHDGRLKPLEVCPRLSLDAPYEIDQRFCFLALG